MTYWRPASEIRVKVLGMLWHGGRFLAVDVRDDAGNLKGVRPLGGSVAFGETRETALAREFMEEVGQTIRLLGPWEAYENLYWHEGERGHEILFIAPIAIDDPAFLRQEVIHFQEDNGMPCIARWFTPEDVQAGRLCLFPEGHETALLKSRSVP